MLERLTATAQAQHALELKVTKIYSELVDLTPEEREEGLTLFKERVIRYVHSGLGQLPAGFASLDASKPWICYWTLHSLAMLQGGLPPGMTSDDVVEFLCTCQHPSGGFGGGKGQIAHLAPTYAAVNALITLGTEAAYQSIDIPRMESFLKRVAMDPSGGGGFAMHEGMGAGPWMMS
jgi:protein farnesyltransferase subunit beta